MERDGYLYIKQLIPRAKVETAYRTAVDILEKEKAWPWGKFSTSWTNCPQVMEHVNAPELQDVFRMLFDESDVTSLPFKWIRSMPPQSVFPQAFSQFHCDNVYMNRGTNRIYTSWLPMQDIDYAMGGLAVMEKSHSLPGFSRLRETYAQHDFMSLPGVVSNGGNFSPDPEEVLAFDPDARFLTSEFQAGDALIFTMYTIHGSVRNTSDRVRLSADVRWQPTKDKMDPRYKGEATSMQEDIYVGHDKQKTTSTWVSMNEHSDSAITWEEQKRRWGLAKAA